MLRDDRSVQREIASPKKLRVQTTELRRQDLQRRRGHRRVVELQHDHRERNQRADERAGAEEEQGRVEDRAVQGAVERVRHIGQREFRWKLVRGEHRSIIVPAEQGEP